MIRYLATLILLSSTFAFADEPNGCEPGNFLRKVVTIPERRISVEIKPHEFELQTLNKEMLNEIKYGEKIPTKPIKDIVCGKIRKCVTYTYFVDTEGAGHYVKGEISPDEFTDIFLIKSKPPADRRANVLETVFKGRGEKLPSNPDQAYIIREMGTLSWDSEAGALKVTPKKAWDLTEDEANAVANEAKTVSKETPIEKGKLKREFARDIKCTEVIADSKKNQRKQLMNDMLGSTYATALTLAVVEGPSFFDADKRFKVTGDIAQSFLAAGANHFLKRELLKRNAPILLDYTAKNLYANFLVSPLIKQPVYKATSAIFGKGSQNQDNDQIRNQIYWYDMGYGMLQYFPKRAVDVAVMKNLPLKLAEMCSKNPNARLFFGPQMIRMVDKGFWSAAYYVGRDYLHGLDAGQWMSDEFENKIKKPATEIMHPSKDHFIDQPVKPSDQPIN